MHGVHWFRNSAALRCTTFPGLPILSRRTASAFEQIEALADALGLPTAPLEVERPTGSLPYGKSRRALLLATAGLAAASLAGLFVFRLANSGNLDAAASSASTASLPGASRPAARAVHTPRAASGPPPSEGGAVPADPSSPAKSPPSRTSKEVSSRSRRATTDRPVARSKNAPAPDPLADQK